MERGGVWIAVLMLAPVYLTYRTYDVFLERLEEQKRHVEETTRLHDEAVTRCCRRAGPSRRSRRKRSASR